MWLCFNLGMTDETLPPPAPTPDPQGATDFPPLPPTYAIPVQLIESWLKIPPTEYVHARATRADLDSLLFGMTKSVEAQQSLHDCIIRWSNGDVAGANKAMDTSKRRAIESENHMRQFFSAIMASVVAKP